MANPHNKKKSKIKDSKKQKGDNFQTFLPYIIIFIVVSIVFENIINLSIGIIISIFVTIYLFKKSCDNCHKLFADIKTSRKYLKTISRPYKYVIETRYLYSDGSYKVSKFGDEKVRYERIKQTKVTGRCKGCNNIRYEKIEEENLDESTRPETVIEVTTNISPPRRCVICDGRLGADRRKYCSQCRPTYTSLSYA